MVLSHCFVPDSQGRTTSTSKSAAFQYSPLDVADKYKCFRLSADVADHPGNETWSLIEPENPSRGVQVKYEGGDLCCENNADSCASPVHRSLELQFYCKDDTANSFDDETVLEYGSCHYRIWLDTSFGCPTRESFPVRGLLRSEERKLAAVMLLCCQMRFAIARRMLHYGWKPLQRPRRVRFRYHHQATSLLLQQRLGGSWLRHRK